MAPLAGASGLRAAPKSVSVGPREVQKLRRLLGRGRHSCLNFFPQHLPGLKPEHPELGWIWVLAFRRGVGVLRWDSRLRVKLVLVSELESDGLEVSLWSRMEIEEGSELSLRVEMETGDVH